MDLDSRVKNMTPMTVRCIPLADRHGRDMAVAIAKLTLWISADGRVLVAPRRDIRETDVFLASDRPSSMLLPSDVVDEKPGTDVLLIGCAHPPEETKATHLDVSVLVAGRHAQLRKSVRVHGPRVWHRSAVGIQPGPAGVVEKTPLVYELTYGGTDASDPERVLIDPRNPVGMGVVREKRRLIDQPAPRLEDPAAPLSATKPRAAAFGPIAAHWSPRVELAGTYDARWRRERAPIRPLDFDPKHNCLAAPDLWSREPLQGGETVTIVGATPGGPWRFRLPQYVPRFRSVIRGTSAAVPTHLDTVFINADGLTVELSWRARVPLPRYTAQLELVEVSGEGLLPVMPAESAGR